MRMKVEGIPCHARIMCALFMPTIQKYEVYCFCKKNLLDLCLLHYSNLDVLFSLPNFFLGYIFSNGVKDKVKGQIKSIYLRVSKSTYISHKG